MRNEIDRPPPSVAVPERRAWVSPRLEVLPRLTELTLQSGIPGGGNIGGGGGTVF